MSTMTPFATYLYPHTCYTSRPFESIPFMGQSIPHFNTIREELAKCCTHYPVLDLRKANIEDYFSVHSKEYIGSLIRMAQGDESVTPPRLSIECSGLEYCLPGYLYGLGGMMEAIDRMRQGTLQRAYCFSPGGHHAYSDWGHGYCVLNPQAAAVRYAQTQGFKKVLIIDWDIHHGDGTQTIFTNDPNVYCISIHSAIDMYMAIMRVLSKGTTVEGQKTGHCNIPLLDDTIDKIFIDKMHLPGSFYRANSSLTRFSTALEELPWNPDIISIFSGYDSHSEDCGKDITNWSNTEYRILTKQVTALARRIDSPILSVHGDGYKVPVTVAAALHHIEVLADGS